MLQDTTVRSLKPRAKVYRVRDDRGLYIEIQPAGGRYWRYRYRFQGKARMLSLGVYPETSLAAARDRRDEARRVLKSGVDPSAQRKLAKLTARLSADNTFEAVAREWLAKRKKLAEVTRGKIEWALTSYVFPWIGARPIADITVPELLVLLRRPEGLGKVETARRTKQIVGQVFRYAIQTGRATSDPARDLKGALTTVDTRHYASVTDPQEIGELLRAIDGFQGSFIVACALRLAPLVFVRPGELRRAEWSEIDLDAALWSIPPAKMKKRRLHLVPLARQAVAILREIHPLTGSGLYVFPSVRSRQVPMSENTITAALRRLGYSGNQMTAHGFRSMASTRLNEAMQRVKGPDGIETKDRMWSPDAIERQLAHVESNSTRAAYNAAEYLPERTRMMQWWADYLDSRRHVNNDDVSN